MQFMLSAETHAGITKSVNQDSFWVQSSETPIGQVAFAVICDGMGGLSHGELASATVTHAFSRWASDRLPRLCRSGALCEQDILSDWTALVNRENEILSDYGRQQGVKLGTTATALLLAGDRYYALNVGDTRAYELHLDIRQLTQDHTVTERDVASGLLTREEARIDPRRHVLLQCIGAGFPVQPHIFSGTLLREAVYLLCSDGLRDKVTSDELFSHLRPALITQVSEMEKQSKALIQLNMKRHERDNISIVLIRTY